MSEESNGDETGGMKDPWSSKPDDVEDIETSEGESEDDNDDKTENSEHYAAFQAKKQSRINQRQRINSHNAQHAHTEL